STISGMKMVAPAASRAHNQRLISAFTGVLAFGLVSRPSGPLSRMIRFTRPVWAVSLTEQLPIRRMIGFQRRLELRPRRLFRVGSLCQPLVEERHSRAVSLHEPVFQHRAGEIIWRLAPPGRLFREAPL